MRKPEREMPKWRLIPRVQDIGFFQGVVRSRQTLVVAALGTTVFSVAAV